MIINKTNKVDEALTEHPELKNEIINISPNFNKTKNLLKLFQII